MKAEDTVVMVIYVLYVLRWLLSDEVSLISVFKNNIKICNLLHKHGVKQLLYKLFIDWSHTIDQFQMHGS